MKRKQLQLLKARERYQKLYEMLDEFLGEMDSLSDDYNWNKNELDSDVEDYLDDKMTQINKEIKKIARAA